MSEYDNVLVNHYQQYDDMIGEMILCFPSILFWQRQDAVSVFSSVSRVVSTFYTGLDDNSSAIGKFKNAG